MSLHPLAGKAAPAELLIDTAGLERDYYARRPDVGDPNQRVAFGTSGHRGTPLDGTFTEAHILAIVQAVCDYRRGAGIDGPLFLGKDTHAASEPAQRTAVEVLAANGVTTILQEGGQRGVGSQGLGGFTPTPVVSHAILSYNRGRAEHLADGLIITPSHNPPSDGGIKYNPPNGGPADTDITSQIQDQANALLASGNAGVKRTVYERAMRAECIRQSDLRTPYVAELAAVVDLEAIRAAKVRIGVDPLGGSAVEYWAPIAERYGLDLSVVNAAVDPRFSFMSVDHDGKIRMDCSSACAMAGLVKLKDRFAIAFANDPDADRHGIVTPTAGLMNPNHYLAVAIRYLLTHRPKWRADAAVGKTLVSSSLIDRVVASLGRKLLEVPVGFKWFTPGLFDGSLCFGGEESAGACFVRRDGGVWATDKDGLILGLLAAEIVATTGKDPGEHYREIVAQFGEPCYRRIDAPASPAQKAAFKNLSARAVTATQMAGEPITAKLTHAPGNGAAIGGLKVVTENGWFAARPSGTENIYKIYAESFRGPEHLDRVLDEAQQIVTRSLGV